MPEPPELGRKQRAVARLTRNERNKINEYGLKVPSRNSENYQPNLNSHAVLWNAGTLPGTRPFNYRNKANLNKKSAWNEYLEQRAKAEANASGSNTRRNKNKKGNNGKKNNTRNKRTGNYNANDLRVKLGF